MKKEFILANLLVGLGLALYFFTTFFSQNIEVYDGIPNEEFEVALRGIPVWIPIAVLLFAGLYFGFKGIRKNARREV